MKTILDLYDQAGDLTSFEGTGTNLFYRDASHKHAVTHVGGTAPGNQKYWYDPNGNATRRITGSQDISLSYDAEPVLANRPGNRLSAVSGQRSASYSYDGDGTLVKAVDGTNNITTIVVGSHYEVRNGVVKKYYIIPEGGYAGDVRVAESDGGTLYWLLSDHLGSTHVTLDSASNRVTELR